MDYNPERHGRVSDRDLRGDFLARLYTIYQIKPIWLVGCPPTCKSFKEIQLISINFGVSTIRWL